MGKVKELNNNAKNVVETIVYTLACWASFGAIWLLKIIIKKAVIEADDY